MEKDDGKGAVQLFRVVRIPFRVACVSGNLKMRLRVNQDRRTRKVSHFSMNHRESPAYADQTFTMWRGTSLRSVTIFWSFHRLAAGRRVGIGDAKPSCAVQIHFDSLKEGRLIKNFLATFDIVGAAAHGSTCCRSCDLACRTGFAGCSCSVAAEGVANRLLMPAVQRCAETDPGRSTVHLDAKISAAQLPPPPFKSLVKGASHT